jgi:hypothetical protein
VSLEMLTVSPPVPSFLDLRKKAEDWAGFVASVDRLEGRPLDVQARH